MISGFSSNREEFCSKTWYPTMKKTCELFMERGQKSLNGKLKAGARNFVRNVETSLLGKLK